MTDEDIRLAACLSWFLRSRIEKQVRYGAPLNERVLLSGHPESLRRPPH